MGLRIGYNIVGKNQRSHEEHDTQTALVQWFRMQYPRYAKLLFAIPNGAHLAKKKVYSKKEGREILICPQMKRLKDEGLTKGVPDMFLSIARGHYHGFYIETKSTDGRPSKDQVEQQEALICQGFKVCNVKSFDVGQSLLKEYMALDQYDWSWYETK
jgi:hypothetical protein